MIKNMKLILASLAFVGLLLSPAALSTASAQTTGSGDSPNLQGNLCGGASNLQFGDENSNCDVDETNTTVNSMVATVINIFSVVVGIVAVIMIIYGGFKYITSGGDSGKITEAKNSILFAIVGLIIVAMAQIIVKFVLSKAIGDSSS